MPEPALEANDLLLELVVLHLGGGVVLDALAEVVVADDLRVLAREALALARQLRALLQRRLQLRLERLLLREELLLERLVPVKARWAGTV